MTCCSQLKGVVRDKAQMDCHKTERQWGRDRCSLCRKSTVWVRSPTATE